MGSHLSCISPAASNRACAIHPSSDHTTKFLNCETGAISELEGSLTAAEAMMEFPAQFLCSFSSAVASRDHGRRISAVLADQELQASELYLLLPMHRLNSRFSMEEMSAFASLEAVRNCNAKQGSCRGATSILQSKVAAPLPAPAAVSDAILKSIAESKGSRSFEGLRQDDGTTVRGAAADSSRQLYICKPKSWMPKLETVNEYAVVF